MTDYLVWLAALMVLLAGCAGWGTTPTPPPEEGESPTPAKGAMTKPKSTPTTTLPPTPTPFSTPTPTTTPTPVPVPDNPWEKETVVVSINDSGRDRDFEPIVRDGVAFWTTERMAQHADYQVEFVVRQKANDPDIEVRVLDSITTCGFTVTLGDWLGCAPILSNDSVPNEPVLVEISAAQTNFEFQQTVAHEFGHVLGVTHNDTPTWLMTHDDANTTETNATDRSHPWNHTGDIKVFVRDGFQNQDQVEREVGSAANYYNQRKEEYLPDGTRVVVVDHWYEADIIFQNRSPPGVDEVFQSPGSQPYIYGLDWDSDHALEWYTVTYIYIEGADDLDIEYHAGYWIGRLANNDPDELPRRYRP